MIRFHFNNIIIILIVIAFQSVLLSCNSKTGASQIIEKEYYPNGNLKAIGFERSDGAMQIFSLDTTGNCTDLLTSAKGKMKGDQFWFYPNGFLKQKTGYKRGYPDGFSYEFYSSGAIKNFRYLRNGLEYDLGLDYFDTRVLF